MTSRQEYEADFQQGLGRDITTLGAVAANFQMRSTEALNYARALEDMRDSGVPMDEIRQFIFCERGPDKWFQFMLAGDHLG